MVEPLVDTTDDQMADSRVALTAWWMVGSKDDRMAVLLVEL